MKDRDPWEMENKWGEFVSDFGLDRGGSAGREDPGRAQGTLWVEEAEHLGRPKLLEFAG